MTIKEKFITMVTAEKSTEQIRRDTILQAGVEVFLEYGYVRRVWMK